MHSSMADTANFGSSGSPIRRPSHRAVRPWLMKWLQLVGSDVSTESYTHTPFLEMLTV